jgi:ribosomal protein L37AE/L43A
MVDENKQRLKSLIETRERRLNQQCKVFRLKIQQNHLSKLKREYLKRLFLEKKWFRNYVLAQNNAFEQYYKLKSVQIKTKNGLENRDLNYLSSQMKQSICSEVIENIKALSKSKKNGHIVGQLKFASECNMIDLVQNENTYKLRGNYLYLQGFKGSFKVNGIKQIPIAAELANAKLIKKPSGVYIHITCFLPRPILTATAEIGFDFNATDDIIVDSNSNKFNWEFKESKRLKSVACQLNKRYVKRQKQSKKQKQIYRLEIEKLQSKKKDAQNKFCSWVFNNHSLIAIQDENLGWRKAPKIRSWGNIHKSIMNEIICDIKKMPQTIIIPKYVATVKSCPDCNSPYNFNLDNCIYICENCSYEIDRANYTAQNTLRLAKQAKLNQLKNQATEHSLYLDEVVVPHLRNDSRSICFFDICSSLTNTEEGYDDMSKYHVRPDGRVAICNATKIRCPYGNEKEHYASIEEAKKAFQERMEAEFNFIIKQAAVEFNAEFAQSKHDVNPARKTTPKIAKEQAEARKVEIRNLLKSFNLSDSENVKIWPDDLLKEIYNIAQKDFKEQKIDSPAETEAMKQQEVAIQVLQNEIKNRTPVSKMKAKAV